MSRRRAAKAVLVLLVVSASSVAGPVAALGDGSVASHVAKKKQAAGAGLYHWELAANGIVNGYYRYSGGAPEALTGYYWRQPSHPGDCYS